MIKSTKILCLASVLLLSSVVTTVARVFPMDVNFHNAQNDTTRITTMLIDAEKIPDVNERIVALARLFLDTPYQGGTLESTDGTEQLTVNLDAFDCTTFVETVLALAKTAGEHRTSWRDYVGNLEAMRYRNGEMNGYPSRLHYFSDWVVENTHRGNIAEVTSHFPDYRSEIKTLEFMTKNAGKYPALADSANLAAMKNAEMGYRKHQYPYLPWNVMTKKNIRQAFKEGDVVALLTKTPGLDVTHLGFIVKDEKGVPYLLHASSKQGKVVVDKTPLADYLQKQKSPGIRIIRLKD